MNNKYLLKAMNNEYVIFLHNGYAEFSYGVSVNPIMLSFHEYNTLMGFITKSNFKEIVTKFENSQNYDFKIPECIAKKIVFEHSKIHSNNAKLTKLILEKVLRTLI